MSFFVKNRAKLGPLWAKNLKQNVKAPGIINRNEITIMRETQKATPYCPVQALRKDTVMKVILVI